MWKLHLERENITSLPRSVKTLSDLCNQTKFSVNFLFRDFCPPLLFGLHLKFFFEGLPCNVQTSLGLGELFLMTGDPLTFSSTRSKVLLSH